MKTVIKTLTIAFVAMLAFGCKKATENIKIVVDMDIIKYTALIHVSDPAKPAVAIKNASITIAGKDADDIYEISGKKEFSLAGGILTIGPGPDAVPSVTDTVSCVVKISAPGYTSIDVPVTFIAGKMQQVISVSMVKPGAPVPTPTQSVPEVHNPVSLNFTGTCSQKPDMLIRPSIYVFYRKTGSNEPFAYLGYLDKGNITTTALAQGTSYDFQLTYAGTNYIVSQKVDDASYELTFDMNEACNNL